MTAPQHPLWSDWCEALPAEPDSDSQVVTTARGPVEYVRRESGPVVVAVHGTPGSCFHGARTFRHLSDEGFSIVAPSRPGYGRTPLTAGQTWEEQADAIIALMDALHVDRFGVAGASAGGPAAIQMALRSPERVWALVLERAVLDHVKWSADDSTAGNRGLANDLAQLAAFSALPLEKIAAPVLILHGTDDADVPFSQAIKARQKIPDCELRPVEGGTHQIWQAASWPAMRQRQNAFLRLFAPEGT